MRRSCEHMFVVHPPAVKQEALVLVAAGLNDCAVGRFTGVPRRTVQDWRRFGQRPPRRHGPTCPRCWQPSRPITLSAGDYVELLGLYLGDGHISAGARTSALRLSLDAGHPRIVADSRALLARGFPSNRVQHLIPDRGNTVVLKVYHRHLDCLFPLSGPGKKHLRPILLEPWQHELVTAAPWRLLRGLIRSDGCVFINRTGPYEYLSYDFTNRSQDILDLFTATCDQMGVQYRRNPERIRICRREAVGLMLEHVGIKG